MFREFSENGRSEEFLNEFRQKMADQTASNIEERQNEMRRSRSVFIGSLAGLILAGIVGGFILSPHYNKNYSENVPVIKRSPDVAKSAPKERGGMEIADQDKSVYEILESKSEEVVVEKVLPAPEEPKMPEITPVEEETSVATIDDIIDQASEDVAEDASKVLAGQLPEQKTAENEVIAQPEKVVEEVKAVEEEKAVETVKKAAESGDWQVQIMSSPNKDSVEKSWQTLSKKHEFFNALPYEIEQADLGASGIYYRLKVGAFAEKAAADALCEQYKAQKGSCIVKKK